MKKSATKIELLFSKFFGFSPPTYFNWIREQRPVILFFKKYFEKEEMQEFLSSGKINKLERVNQLFYLLHVAKKTALQKIGSDIDLFTNAVLEPNVKNDFLDIFDAYSSDASASIAYKINTAQELKVSYLHRKAIQAVYNYFLTNGSQNKDIHFIQSKIYSLSQFELYALVVSVLDKELEETEEAN